MVAVLFVEPFSIYKVLPGCDCYDEKRDALTFVGNQPVIAHPPCRGWGRLRKTSNATPYEKQLGKWAVEVVRLNGGILEQPSGSKLFEACELPRPSQKADCFGGWTLTVNQFHWGHNALKPTWLYIVGCSASDLPPMPHREGSPLFSIGGGVKRKLGIVRDLPKRERKATPIAFAEWLIQVANKCSYSKKVEILGSLRYP